MTATIGKLSIDPVALGSQGNAVLGIRASGKSYLGTLLAERLMDAGIPIIAFDPIGVWRYLQVPGRGAGYKVVVAGGEHGNLPLTPEGAPEIVRAAMREGVSLVIDLYSMKLSKADWRRIVERCVRVLLYENKGHGLRHVFIEEAAEFCPQVVGRDYGTVYAEIEKLARMGGNALLGYTLISQRAEQVNKAVLELCDNLFLFRQKGRLSLTALSKWLDIGSAKGGAGVIESLPTLPQGVCWAWPAGHDTPIRVEVPEKRSFHPDRSAMHGELVNDIVNRSAVDVGQFVETMKVGLEKLTAEADANDPAKLRKQIAQMQKMLVEKGPPEHKEIEEARHKGFAAGKEEGYGDGYAHGVQDERMRIGKMVTDLAGQIAVDIGAEPPASQSPKPDTEGKPVPSKPVEKINTAPTSSGRGPVNGFTGPQGKIIRSLSMWKALGHDDPSKIMVAVAAGYRPTSGGYANLLGQLRGAGAIDYPVPNHVRLIAEPEALSVEDGRDLLLGTLSNPQRKLFDALIAHGEMSKDELADATEYSRTSGGYANLLGQLRSMGLVEYPAPGRVVLASWVMEIA